MSSTGTLVECPQKVRTGARLELKIEIPQRLDGMVRLQIFALGRVVRCEESRFATTISRYQYRTMGWTAPSVDVLRDEAGKRKKPAAKAASA